MEKHSGLDLLLETELRHLYTAEKRSFDNLKILADQAVSSELKTLLNDHRKETQNQIGRLEQIFNQLKINIKSTKLQGLPGITAKGKELLKLMVDLNFTDQSKGMNGIIDEAKELLRHFKNTDVNDFAIASAASKVEHFEIACYEMLCDLAEMLENEAVLKLLDTTLEEEVGMKERILDFASATCAC